MPADALDRLPRPLAWAVALLAGAGALAYSPPCLAFGGRGRLLVTRDGGSAGCPDAAALSAAVARVVGRDVFDAGRPGAGALTVDVSFARRDGAYVATVAAKAGAATGERTISDRGSRCSALGEAVAAALALMLDDIPDEAPATATPAPPPAPASAPIDPDDIPPKDTDPLEPIVATTATTAPSGVWYGWQTLAADGGVVATAIVLSQLDSSGGAATAAFFVVLGTYLVDGPVVHLAHGQPDAAAGSLALRLALPLAGGLVSYAVWSCSPGEFQGLCQSLSVLPGAAVGMLAASIVDAAALSWDRSDRAHTAGDVRVTPTVTFAYEGERRTMPLLGLVGSF